MKFFLSAAITLTALLLPAQAASMSIYVSGYTDNGGEGIYHYDFNSADGTLTNGKLAVEAVQPSFIVLNEAHNTLYATIEVGDYLNQSSGAIQTFRRNPVDGSLTSISEYATDGEAPCYASAISHDSSKYLYVANYNGGSISSFPIKYDGDLKEIAYLEQHTGPGTFGVPERQEAPHSHSFDTIGKDLAVSCDLGEDKLYVYKREADGYLEKIVDYTFVNGTGPRHVAISKDEKKVYVIGELSVEVFVFDISKKGKLTLLQTLSALPEGDDRFATGAEIMLTPNGKFLYISVRETDLIAKFAVNKATGKLTLLGHLSSGGVHPRFFTIDPSGKYLLVGNMISNTINVFAIDNKTGDLTPIHTISHPQPTCIQFWK